LLVVPIALATALWSSVPASGGPVRPGRAGEGVRGDFNGDGFADLAVGSSLEKVGSVSRAGAVHVLYGSANGITTDGATRLTQEHLGISGPHQTDSLFGAALAAGDFNGDGFADLAVGAPYASGDLFGQAGMVVVFPGSADGLSNENGVIFDERDAGETVEGAEQYGTALATGDFNHDGKDDLAFGGPDESIDG